MKQDISELYRHFNILHFVVKHHQKQFAKIPNSTHLSMHSYETYLTLHTQTL